MERSRSNSGNVPSNGSVKIGGLWKRSQGLSRFTRPNYRHRVFILTENALSYYSGTVDRVGQLKGRVALDTITAVEFVEESAFNLPHTFQVVYHTKKSGFVVLYVTSTDNSECAEWVATIRQACYFNKDMAMHYHPGALLKNNWTCCKQSGKTSLGCQPTYHLLTRSSSRYAQMRRKDTLTSSQGSRRSQRSKSSSVPREERLSPAPGEEEEERGSRRMLSNSCFDLTHRQIKNNFEPVEEDSPTSSGEPSVSMGCITLTRLSLSESTTPLCVPLTPLATPPAPPPSETARSPGKRSRVQIAPEYTPSIRSQSTFPTAEYQSSQRSTNIPVLPNRFSHSSSTNFTTNSLTTPNSGQQQTTPAGHSSQLTPVSHTQSLRIPPVTYHCMTEPRKSRRKTLPTTGTLSQPQSQMSTSMSHLLLPNKPHLEPKISVTDPNTIHV